MTNMISMMFQIYRKSPLFLLVCNIMSIMSIMCILLNLNAR